jgi:cytochrome c551/c552
MKTLIFAGVILAAGAAFASAQTAPGSAPMSLDKEKALVNQYCAGCHNDKLKSGGFSWSKVDLAHPDQNAEQAEKVVRKLRAGMMPPAGMPRPDAATLTAFRHSIETGIDTVAAKNPNPGRPALHRLNRAEYANSVRDLLGVNIDVAELLPPDSMSHGFDNMSDVLNLSPALMEGYVRAASRASREALGDPDALAITKTYQISRVQNQMHHVEGTPFGTRGGLVVNHDFPADGEYQFKVGFYYNPTGPLFGQMQAAGMKVVIALDGEKVAIMDVDPRMTLAKDGLKSPMVFLKAGPHRLSASFTETFDGPIEDEYRMVEQTLVDVSAGSMPGITALPHMHELSVTGPNKVVNISQTPSRKRVFSCVPAQGQDDVPCAKEIIARLAKQAYRRPLSDTDLENLLNFYQQGKNAGGFDIGIRTALQAILASPRFVFRFEETPSNVAPGQNYRISDLELASRLSYFLWSSSPDNQLIDVAAQNKLHEPATLEREVKRMIADQKSSSLSTIFADQWLHLQNLKDVSPDLYFFPDFDRTLSASLRRETQLLFDSIVRDDSSVLDLLSAKYTFVDERLARHYGIPNILGNRFRRVELTDPNRYGLLGQGSILMLTSTAVRTSPVQRGKYVIEVLLGTVPPTPPPNVPPLKENQMSEAKSTVRERMEAHRKNEPCHSCHQLIDPMGLSLENFDAVGTWRTNDSGSKIDPSSTMYDGTKLNGPASLREAILGHSDAFLAGFAENFTAYALGRVVDSPDMPTVRAIEREAAKNNNKFSAFVMGIVKSNAFQMRRADETVSSTTTVVAP